MTTGDVNMQDTDQVKLIIKRTEDEKEAPPEEPKPKVQMEFPSDIRDYRPDSFNKIKDVIIDRKGIFKYI